MNRIEISGSKAKGYRVRLNGEALRGCQRIAFSADAESEMATVTLTLLVDQVDIAERAAEMSRRTPDLPPLLGEDPAQPPT